MTLGPVLLSDDAPHAKVARASWARFIKKVFAADPLECPDCGGAMWIVAFIEEQRVVRAILEHLSLWDEPRPPSTLTLAPCAPVELDQLPRVERPSPGGGMVVVCRDAGQFAALLVNGGSSCGQDPAEHWTSASGNATILPVNGRARQQECPLSI
jgi:hypothetical protein